MDSEEWINYGDENDDDDDEIDCSYFESDHDREKRFREDLDDEEEE